MGWVPEARTDTLSFLLHRDLGRPTVESDAVADVRVEPVRRFMKAFDSDTSYTNRVVVALARPATPEDPVELPWTYGGRLHDEHIRLGASLLTRHWVELQIGSVWLPVAESLRVVIPPVPRARSNAYARPGLIALNHGRQADLATFNLLAHEAAHLWWTDADDTQSRHNFLNESFAEDASFSFRA